MLSNLASRLATALLVASSPLLAQSTWWVDAGAAPGGNGQPGSPFQHIQAAIAVAHNGDTVLVQPGTYGENVNYGTKSIVVASTSGAAATVIQGSGSGSVVHLRGVAPVLDGFTIENGSGTTIGTEPGTTGGGILFEDTAAGATVRNCVVRHNYAARGDGIGAYRGLGQVVGCTIENNGGPSYPGWCGGDDLGGGVYAEPYALTLDGCTIRNNFAAVGGGGAYGCSLSFCYVQDNYAAIGAGVSHVIASYTTFEHNTAESCDLSAGTGGAAAWSTLDHCLVINNTAWDEGGGAWNSTLTNCRVIGNSVTTSGMYGAWGGGIATCHAVDCWLENNSVYVSLSQPGQGGAMQGSTALRCVLVGNHGQYGAGAFWSTLDRCLVYANDGPGVELGFGTDLTSSIIRANTGVQISGSGAVVAYSDVAGGWPGVGNIDADPRFWNAAASDFHLMTTSPCIDAGDPAVLDPDGTRSDMGPFPYSASDCLAPVSYCPAGSSSDGCVATLSTFGSPSLSASSGFEIRATHLPGARLGVVIYGVTGESQAPWGGTSFMCIAPPRQRTGTHSTNGTPGACDGALILDFNAWRTAHPFALGAPFSAGDVVYAQAWYRDSAAALSSNLTGAVRFVTCP